MKQLNIDLRIQDEMDFDGEISRIITETAQTRIKEGTLARSKHEAYGIAAENLAQVCSTVKVLNRFRQSTARRRDSPKKASFSPRFAGE